MTFVILLLLVIIMTCYNASHWINTLSAAICVILYPWCLDLIWFLYTMQPKGNSIWALNPVRIWWHEAQSSTALVPVPMTLSATQIESNMAPLVTCHTWQWKPSSSQYWIEYQYNNKSILKVHILLFHSLKISCRQHMFKGVWCLLLFGHAVCVGLCRSTTGR